MRRAGAVATVAAVLVLAGTACSADHSHPSTPTGPPPPGYFQLAGPVGLAVAGAGVWTVSVKDGAVVGRDASSGRFLGRVPVGDTPLRAAFDGHLLWVTVFGAGQVVAVDVRTKKIVHRVKLPGQPEGITVAFGSVWVVRQQAAKLTRVSLSGAVGESYPLAIEPRLVTAGADALYVADVTDGTITRVDPKTRRRTVSGQVCDGPQNLADDQGTLWVTCTRSNAVIGLDDRTLQVDRKFTVAGQPDGIRVVAGRIYVVATAGPAVYELAPEKAARFIRLTKFGDAAQLDDQANDDLVVTADRIWVSDYQSNRVYSALRGGAG